MNAGSSSTTRIVCMIDGEYTSNRYSPQRKKNRFGATGKPGKQKPIISAYQWQVNICNAVQGCGEPALLLWNVRCEPGRRERVSGSGTRLLCASASRGGRGSTSPGTANRKSPDRRRAGWPARWD